MQKSGSNDLYMLNMKDYQLTQMTRRVDVVQPRWSPDGKNLVFAGSESIYRLDMETGQYVKIDPPGFSHSAFPTFSPDGSKILFASFRDGDRTWLYLMKYDGTQIEPVNISDHLLGSVQLDWSSDGKSVLFVPYLGVYRDHFLGQFNLLPPHP